MNKFSNLPEYERPREKLAKKGVKALTSHELLMIILGRGMKNRDVAAQASDILKVIESGLDDISIDKLMQVKGVGLAKATQIISALEFAKRYLIKEDKKIFSTDDVLQLVEYIRNKKQEYFLTLTLTGASSLIEKREVFKGTIDHSFVHPREIFSDALIDRAAGMIFVHNHPADDAKPSEADIKLTKQLCEAGKLLGITVIDHIIVTKNEHFSFKTEGIIEGQL